MKLGNGDNMQTDTRFQSWSTRLISVLYVSHKYLISELNSKIKRPKTYFIKDFTLPHMPIDAL